jgi:hypothetical protein
MAEGELGAVFKGLAEDVDQAGGQIADSMARISEQTADNEEANVANTLDTEAQNAKAFTDITDGAPARAPAAESSTIGSKLADDGGWEGENGLHLSPQENAAADHFLANARDAESKISPVVLGIRDEIPAADTVGYPDYVVKDPESFKRKLATTLAESPNRDLDGALADMKDSVRYTLKFPGEGTTYTDGVTTTIDRFTAAGYEPVKFKNTWGSPAYQGINSFWRDPQTGHVFEMQFHTQDSFDAKMVTHDLYEQARLPGVPLSGSPNWRPSRIGSSARSPRRPAGQTCDCPHDRTMRWTTSPRCSTSR